MCEERNMEKASVARATGSLSGAVKVGRMGQAGIIKDSGGGRTSQLYILYRTTRP